MVSDRAEQYRDRAARCFELAARTYDRSLQQTLGDVARSYLLLARLEEKLEEQSGLGWLDVKPKSDTSSR